jgi:hypothetical protein
MNARPVIHRGSDWPRSTPIYGMLAASSSQTQLGTAHMATSRWHKLYSSRVGAPPAILFELLSDMPNYGRWLLGSGQFAETTDVEPYPVRLGSRYHDGKPGQPGKDWWGTVTGFQAPGSPDFHHTIQVSQLRAIVDVHIHYSFEPEDGGTQAHPTGTPSPHGS